MHSRELIESYHSHHMKLSTQLTHFIGVPLILYALILLLRLADAFLPFGLFSWAFFLSLTLFYMSIDIFLTLGFVLCMIPLLFIASNVVGQHSTAFTMLIIAVNFIIGWIFQLLGHYFEGNKPAFLTNVMHGVVAPLFLVDKLYKLVERGLGSLNIHYRH